MIIDVITKNGHKKVLYVTNGQEAEEKQNHFILF
jgi:hypothetical protein